MITIQKTTVNQHSGRLRLVRPIDVNEGENIWLTFVFENNPGTHLPREIFLSHRVL
jgi:hypothetical protein